MKWILLFLILFSACEYPVPNQESISDDGFLDSEMITYGDNFSGYLVRPADSKTYPGVVLIHEWWGLNEHIKNQADKLALDGYTVLAVDLYDGKVAEGSDEARKYSSFVRSDPDRAIKHMKSAVSYLREISSSVGSLGWCFGGGMSLQLALNEEMDATAMYYGPVITNGSQLTAIDWPVLGVFGGEDQSIKVEDVRKFEQAMDELDIENEVYIYPSVGHAFANPSNPGHDKEKTEDAWKKTVEFLKKNLD